MQSAHTPGGYILPDDGTMTAVCEAFNHQPPGLRCGCGLAFFASYDDIVTTINRLNLIRTHAVTIGTTHPVIRTDHGGRLITSARCGAILLPQAQRCSAYTVTAIATPTPLAYDIPQTKHLTGLHEQTLPRMR